MTRAEGLRGAVAVVLWLASSCGTPAGHQVIRVAYTSTPDFEALPSLMAHRRLAARGYRIEPTFYTQSELAAQAVAGGQAHLGHGASRTFWTAAARGAPIVTLMRYTRSGWYLVTRPDVDSCGKLDGARVGVRTEGSGSTALLEAYRRMRCPGVRMRMLLLSGGSETRAAALMTGELDATILRLTEVLALEREAPGRFHVLVDFNRELPELVTDAVYANAAFARSSPAAVVAYLKTLLQVHREATATPELLLPYAPAALGPASAIAPVVRAYAAAEAWDTSGELSLAAVQHTLDFFAAAGSLPADLRAERMADLSFLQAAVAEMGGTAGRQEDPVPE